MCRAESSEVFHPRSLKADPCSQKHPSVPACAVLQTQPPCSCLPAEPTAPETVRMPRDSGTWACEHPGMLCCQGGCSVGAEEMVFVSRRPVEAGLRPAHASCCHGEFSPSKNVAFSQTLQSGNGRICFPPTVRMLNCGNGIGQVNVELCRALDAVCAQLGKQRKCHTVLL